MARVRLDIFKYDAVPSARLLVNLLSRIHVQVRSRHEYPEIPTYDIQYIFSRRRREEVNGHASLPNAQLPPRHAQVCLESVATHRTHFATFFA